MLSNSSSVFIDCTFLVQNNTNPYITFSQGRESYKQIRNENIHIHKDCNLQLEIAIIDYIPNEQDTALSKMKNDKLPGMGGYSPEFKKDSGHS